MIIPLREVPSDERHLLFCSRLLPRRRSRRQNRRVRDAEAVADRPSSDTHAAEQLTPIRLAAGFDVAGANVGAA
jgi:hypothetical protein